MKTKLADGYKNFAKKINTKEGVISELKSYRTTHDSELYGFIYDNDRLIQRVVEAPVEDAFLSGIESENENIIKLFELSKHLIREAIIKSRVYGLSIIYQGKVLDDEILNSMNVEQNPLRDDYLLPKNVSVRYLGDLDENELILVQQHATNSYILDSGGYGYSVVAGVLEAVKRYYASLNISTDILGTLNQSVIKMKDLNEVILEGREEDLTARLDVINYLKSNLSTLLIDQEDDYINNQKSLAGSKDVIEKNELAICAVSGIPYSRLFGRTQSGLSNAQESDLKNYYDTVVSKIRENYITKVFNKLLEIEGIKGEWTFKPIYQQNSKEKAETLKMNVESVEKLMELGLLGDDEAKSLLGV